MSTIDDFLKEVVDIRQGIELRDFLLNYENYYLEGAGNYALMTPEFITLTNIERLYIDLHSAFVSFHMPIYGFIVVPSRHISMEELDKMAPEGSQRVTAPDGEEGVCITLK